MRLRPDQVAVVAQHCFGEPNARLSRGYKLRWRRHGSLEVDCERGRFRDWEAVEHGGYLAMVIHAGMAHTNAEAWRYISDVCLLNPPPVRPSSEKKPRSKDNSASARRLFLAGRPVGGTLAETYLRMRAIEPRLGRTLRFHSRVWNAEAGGPLPAMLAAIAPLSKPENITAVMRTWLSPAGCKANVEMPKKTLGPVLRGAAVLATFTDEIVVGEGIETTMSASAKFNLPGIATLGASNMAALDVPETVSGIVIAFDRDLSGAGERAAETLARRLWARGARVQLAAPPEGFKDFNDAAMAKAKEKKDV